MLEPPGHGQSLLETLPNRRASRWTCLAEVGGELTSANGRASEREAVPDDGFRPPATSERRGGSMVTGLGISDCSEETPREEVGAEAEALADGCLRLAIREYLGREKIRD